MNLKDYIRGHRQGKEANQLERKAMDDPFLQDAIDGYDSVEGNHISVIKDLEKRITSAQKRRYKRMWIWAAAAVIVLLIGIPLLLHKPYDKNEIPVIVSSEKIQQKQEIPTPSPKIDTLLVAEHNALKKEKDTATKVVQARNNTGNTAGTISLQPDTLDETVVVAFGKQKKVNSVGSISTISASELKIPETEVKDLIGGRIVMEDSVEQAQSDIIIPEEALSLVNQKDKIQVSGRVVDESGNPIPGVTILRKNNRKGTISDIDGNFHLTVSKDEQEPLIASFIGMKGAEIPLKENLGDIMMKNDDKTLDEVAIIAFGRQKKESIIGSATMVKDKVTFGEEEFKRYFINSYDKNICAQQNIDFEVEFFIDPIGRPAQIKIKKNSCPTLENEIKRLLLGSPPWSKTSSKITIRVELP